MIINLNDALDQAPEDQFHNQCSYEDIYTGFPVILGFPQHEPFCESCFYADRKLPQIPRMWKMFCWEIFLWRVEEVLSGNSQVFSVIVFLPKFCVQLYLPPSTNNERTV